MKQAFSAVSRIYDPYRTDIEIPNDIRRSLLRKTPGNIYLPPTDYREEVDQCKYFYRYDPIASTVIDRIVDMSLNKVRVYRGNTTDREYNYFSAVAERINKLLPAVGLEYFVTGMAVIDYGLEKKVGREVDFSLKTAQYWFPMPLWVRNSESIVLRRKPATNTPSVYVEIPKEEREFIQGNGKRVDGTEDREAYRYIARQFPDYVRRVKSGEVLIPLPNVNPILRKQLTSSDWPQPFLVSALSSLKHKMKLRQMDYSIAVRVIESIRHIRAGNDNYPVTEDDSTLQEIQQQLKARIANNEDVADIVYTLFTNHTVDINWVFPPMDALLAPDKYKDLDSDIMFAMGFSRAVITGESNKSNTMSRGTLSGPTATLNEIRDKFIIWMREFFIELAKINKFSNIAEPAFTPLAASDLSSLVEYASDILEHGAISKNTVANMFGVDWEEEYRQISKESENMYELQQKYFPDKSNPSDTETDNTDGKGTGKDNSRSNVPKAKTTKNRA